ncbi:MAG TPA: hypothetical protein VFG42_23215 [Baekduia sp.]|nr:hypothetical protein [Baekduia sp.]HET6509726.1 hypothetical protein [Baekduia sp.]
MSTPPIEQRIAGRARRRRLPRSVPLRVAWLVADVLAIAACAALLLHAVI